MLLMTIICDAARLRSLSIVLTSSVPHYDSGHSLLGAWPYKERMINSHGFIFLFFSFLLTVPIWLTMKGSGP